MKNRAASDPSGQAALSALFFLHAAAAALWTVPFANVLEAGGKKDIVMEGMMMLGVAAFISPLVTGYLADRRLPAERLLALGCFGAAGFLFFAFRAVELHWPAPVFIALMLGYAVCNAPGFGLITTIVLARLDDPQRKFGPVRAWATWGWMIASFSLSTVLHADFSPVSGYAAAALFLVEGIYCLCLPPTPPPARSGSVRLRDLFGWEALRLFRFRDHRVIFITTTMLSFVLAGLYPLTGRHLKDLGDPHPSATMALSQLCEGVMMFVIAWALAKFRLKWVLFAGLCFGILRYALMVTNTHSGVVASIALQGVLFTLFYPTTQIYMKERVEPALRAQAQALLTLLNSGVGSLLGYWLQDVWLNQCGGRHHPDWPKFWAGLLAAVTAVTIYFVFAYRGQGGRGITRLDAGTGK